MSPDSGKAEFLGGAHGGLGEEKHTVPKSELEALIQAVSMIHWHRSGLVVSSDCK